MRTPVFNRAVHTPVRPLEMEAVDPARMEAIEAAAWADLQLSLPMGLRQAFGIEVSVADGATTLLAAGMPALAINRVIGFGMRSPATQDSLASTIATYGAAGVRQFIMQVSPAANPSDLPRWLEETGARVVGSSTKVARLVPAVDSPLRRPRDIEVIEIGPELAMTFEAVVAEPLGVPKRLGEGIRSTIGKKGWRYYLAIHRGAAIGAAAYYCADGYAWFGLAATDEHHRRRGAQTALLLRRLNDAANDGCRWATADTMTESDDAPDQSYRNLCRLGFNKVYDRPSYLVDVAGALN
jgi:hypothetical protein